jgi:hypothetical protein
MNFHVSLESRRLPLQIIAGVVFGLMLVAGNAFAAHVLFIGNSFTYAAGSAVHFYRADTVTDLNGQGIGGVPALFKSFATQAGLNYEVFLVPRCPGTVREHHRPRSQILERPRVFWI